MKSGRNFTKSPTKNPAAKNTAGFIKFALHLCILHTSFFGFCMISYAKNAFPVTKTAFFAPLRNINIKNSCSEKGENMKKLLSIILAFCLAFSFSKAAFADGISFSAKSAVLAERKTGKILFEYNADAPMPPASITKIMTLLLVMEAIESGKLTLETEITASEHACSMGGSQIWLEPGEVFTVHELLKAAAIASANDACTALAEAVSGSEEAFVDLMNQKAAELGMENTVFKNCTGLDAEGHVSTAKDIAKMSAALLSHEKIKEYSTVWMDSLRGGETELTNTNKLVRFYKGCTGLKTGSTDEAGCCLAASAERDGMELISVTLGSPNTDERFAAGRKLLDYGFANFAVASPKPPEEELHEIPVLHGTKDSVSPVFAVPESYLLPKGQESLITQEVILPENLEAPVEKGRVIGRVKVLLSGGEIGGYNILAGEAVEKMSFSAALRILFLEAVSTL